MVHDARRSRRIIGKDSQLSNKTAQVVATVAGLGLIVAYSVLMMASEGSTGWAWLLLVAGSLLLIGGAGLLRSGRAD